MAAVTVYTTPYCSYCFEVKRLLVRAGIEFDEISLAGDPERRRQLAADNGGWRTVPMVFVGGVFVGGHIEVRRLVHSGRLTEMVQTAGVSR